MKRILQLVLTLSLLLPFGSAYGQEAHTGKQTKGDKVDAKELIRRAVREAYASDTVVRGESTAAEPWVQYLDKKSSKDKDGDKLIPIRRDQAEELITQMILEAREPYVRQRAESDLLKRFKIETLKTRLLDQALRNTYVDEYKDRLDRMERLLYVVLLSRDGKLDPTTINTILGGTPTPPSQSYIIGASDAAQPDRKPAAPATGQVVKGPEGSVAFSDDPNAPVQVSTLSDGSVIENFLVQVFFERAKYALSSKSTETLDHLVTWLKENSAVRITLRGYASREGSMSFNNKLSGDRVNAVADYLIAKGIKRERLEVIPSGIDSIKSTLPEARRVDIRPEMCD